MATKKTTTTNDALVAQIIPDAKDKIAKVSVKLPLLEDDGKAKVDQTETVTINGKTTRIRRGEYVDVPVPVYIQLKNKYPDI